MKAKTTNPSSASPDNDDTRGVAAVDRALTVLTAFSARQPQLSLAQMAEATGLYKSTILRLAESLQDFGFLKRDESGTFRLGPAVLSLAETFRSDLHPAEIVMPMLRVLATQTLESASLYVPAIKGKRLCAYRVTSSRAITDNVRAGDLLPIDQGAGGHVLLAFGDVNSQRLSADKLNLVRAMMFAATRGERDSETAAIACPVFGPQGRLEGALCLSGPLQRFSAISVQQMRTPLLEAARYMTLALGGDSLVYNRAAPFIDPSASPTVSKRRPAPKAPRA